MALILDTVQAPAHPRVCGENMRCWPCRQATWGSSPRVRGKPPYSMGRVNCLRLIPACAGKTVTPPPPSPPRSAHPRVCGENSDFRGSAWCGAGSSPRVRGKQHRGRPILTRRGLIPACAGKTATTGTTVARWRAHPRVCGENRHASTSVSTSVGSSPRVRGKRSTRTRPSSSFLAHPRVCGENRAATRRTRLQLGSSPRVRGKPGHGGLLRGVGGLIPACAGKTMIRGPASSW